MVKPVSVLKIVKRVTWDCGEKDHNHLSEEAALNCIKRRPKNKLLPVEIRRQKAIVAMRSILDGLSVKEAGIVANLPYKRVVIHIHHIMRIMSHPCRCKGLSLPFPCSGYERIYNIREHSDIWRARLDLLEKEWLKKLNSKGFKV